MSFTHLPANVASTARRPDGTCRRHPGPDRSDSGSRACGCQVVRRRGAAVESACQRTVLCAALLVPCASALIGLAVTRVRIPIPAFDEAKPSVRAEDAPRRSSRTSNSEPAGDRRMNNAEQPESRPLFRADGHQLSSPAAARSGRPETPDKLPTARAAPPRANSGSASRRSRFA